MSYLRRRESSSSQGQGCGAFAASAEDSARWPALLEFVSADVWPGGESRETGMVMVFVEGGRLKACLSDRDQGLVLFVVADSVGGLFDALEGNLVAGNGDWRRQRERAPRKK